MSFYKEVPGRKTTLESILKFDKAPVAGSTNPVTSEGVKGAIDDAVGDASEALQEQIDEIAEKAGSGYIPKGEASVATLNALSGQENGELYTMTDSGTLTDGSLAVVAGDTVAWDATNSVWYKAMDYAPRQYGTNEVHNLPTIITAFRTGDVIAVDGPSGTAKMSKDDLLKETAENALKLGFPSGVDALGLTGDYTFRYGKNQQRVVFVAVSKGSSVNVYVTSDADAYFKLELSTNNSSWITAVDNTLCPAGVSTQLSYPVSNGQYLYARISSPNDSGATVRITTGNRLYRTILDGKEVLVNLANTNKIVSLAGKVDDTIQKVVNTIYDIAMLADATITFTITPEENGYFVVSLGNGETYSQSDSSGLVAAGSTYTKTISANQRYTKLKLENTNSTKCKFAATINYKNLKDAIFATYDNKAVVDKLNAEFFASLVNAGRFTTSQTFDAYIGKGSDGSVSITQNGSQNAYYTIELIDSEGSVVATSTDLVTHGTTFTKTFTNVSRDCVRVAISSANVMNYFVSFSFDKGMMQLVKDVVSPKLTILDVGSGFAYADIQSAINAVTDASPNHLYEIRVHNDIKYTDLTDLYKLNGTKNTAANPTAHVAAIVGKNWVSVVGWGSKKVVEIEAPIATSGSSLQWVQVAYPRGNFTLRNLYLKLTGGRYAIHQESAGDANSLDINAYTKYEDLTIEHCGNEGYGTGKWGTPYAMASGTAEGSTIEYKNCTFISRQANTPFSFHTNETSVGVGRPRKIILDCCHAIVKDGAVLTTSEDTTKYNPYLGEIGADSRTEVIIKNSDFTCFNLANPCQRGTETTLLEQFKDCSSFAPKVYGHGNRPFLVPRYKFHALYFRTASAGETIDVVGGSAYDDIWGTTLYKQSSSNMNGRCVGKMFINNYLTWSEFGPKYTFSLPYKLGNCADENKTLVIEVNGVQHTITFNENYMTADGSAYTETTTPNISESAVITRINNQLSGVAVVADLSPEVFQSFDDCYETTKNTEAIAWTNGKLMVRDFVGATQTWRRATANEKAEGICFNVVPSGEYGQVYLLDKILVDATDCNVWDSTKGKMYKSDASGNVVETTSESLAVLKCFADGFLRKM